MACGAPDGGPALSLLCCAQDDGHISLSRVLGKEVVMLPYCCPVWGNNTTGATPAPIRPIPCPDCKGTGAAVQVVYGYAYCATCYGQGVVWVIGGER